MSRTLHTAAAEANVSDDALARVYENTKGWASPDKMDCKLRQVVKPSFKLFRGKIPKGWMWRRGTAVGALNRASALALPATSILKTLGADQG